MYKQIIAKSRSAASNMCPQSEPWLTYYVTFTTIYIHHHAQQQRSHKRPLRLIDPRTKKAVYLPENIRYAYCEHRLGVFISLRIEILGKQVTNRRSIALGYNPTGT